MRYWVVLLAVYCGASGCATLTPWRHGNLKRDIARVMTSCAKTPDRHEATGWTEVVRCQNERVRSLVTAQKSPYVGLIEAALACRLTVARGVDTGTVPAEAGEAQLAALDAQLQALPGSVLELLDTMAVVASPPDRGGRY